jgi:hypothetical protein
MPAVAGTKPLSFQPGLPCTYLQTEIFQEACMFFISLPPEDYIKSPKVKRHKEG